MHKYSKNNKKQIILFIICCFSLVLISCANQQPPGGGDEDKTPPKIKLMYPKVNSLNFKGNKISFSFNEYVDKRSFQDAFKIFPKIPGEISFRWGGRDVDVVFEKKLNELYSSKTFVVIINSTLIDIHGNKLEAPFSFAFSTGSFLDSASISGKIFNTEKVVSVAAYLIDNNKVFDPSTQQADYITETTVSGLYTLSNLSKGLYRIIAFDDEDKNQLYTTGRESYGVLNHDLIVTDSSKLSNNNICFKTKQEFSFIKKEYDFRNYYKDSMDIIYSSINDGYMNLLPQQSIYIYFSKYKPSREALSGNVTIKDEKDRPVKFVLNWINDSLIELFASNGFGMNGSFNLLLNLNTVKDSIYKFKLSFRTVSQNSFGEIISHIIKPVNADTLKNMPVVIRIYTKDTKPEVDYLFQTYDTIITMQKILEGEYLIFAFIDLNNNSEYDYGEAYPFMYSEPFYVYPAVVRVKGGWSIDNLIIDFTK